MDFDASSAEPVAAVAEPAFDPSSAEPVAAEQDPLKALPESDRNLLVELGINRGHGLAGARSDAQATGGSFAQKNVVPAAEAAVSPAIKSPDVPTMIGGAVPGVPSDEITQGVVRGGKSTLESLTAPIGAVLAPLAEVKSVSTIAQSIVKAAEAYFAGETAKAGYKESVKVVEAIKDPNATKADVAEHVVNATTALGFATSLGIHATGVKLAGQPVKMDAIDEAGKPVQVELPADEAVRRIDEQAKADRASVYEQAGVKEEAAPPKMVDVPPAPAEPAFDPASAKPVEGEFNPETAQPVQAEAAPVEPAPSSEVRFSVYREQKNAAGETQPGTVQLDRQQDATGKPMTDEERGQFPSPEQILATDLPQGNYSLDEVNAAIAKQKEGVAPEVDTSPGQTNLDLGAQPPVGDESTYGIAARVSEERAKGGNIAPVEPGEGISAQASVEHGRELLKAGGDPVAALDRFKQTGAIHPDDIALTRARGEQLAKDAQDAFQKFGSESPEYKAAAKADSDWIQEIKPMQTAWHKAGQAMQGETEIDTGTFHGLSRAYTEATGKEFTPKQAQGAKQVVERVQKATAEAEKAKQDVFDAITKETPKSKPRSSKIVQALADRADAARARIKARMSEGRVSAGIDPSEIKDYVEIAAYHLAKGVEAGAELLKEFGESVREHLPEILAKARDLVKAVDRIEPDVSVAGIWQRAKDYLDAGETNYDDLRAKIATDTGLSMQEVAEKLAAPKAARTITNEMYAKAAARRAAVTNAKIWLDNQKTPAWLRFVSKVPRAFFAAKVFGHGTVGPVTHAGVKLFDPLASRVWVNNFVRGFKLMGVHDKGAYHEMMMENLRRDPNYITARRAGLANDPAKFADDYQNTRIGGWLSRNGLMGNRGFDSLKLMRQELFNQAWDGLPDSLKTPDNAKLIADATNHATGIVKARFKEWANVAFFAPKLEGSRWAWLIGDPAKAGEIISRWKEATPGEQRFALQQVREKASIAAVYLGLLGINQGMLSAMGSSQKINFTDPSKSDFLAFKVAGHNIGVISPMLGVARLLYNLGHASMGERKGIEKASSRADNIASTLAKYGRGKLSPFAGIAADIATQSDFQKRPLPFSHDKVPAYLRREGVTKYTYGEYLAQNVTPIPVSEAVREVFKKQGMNESTAAHWAKAFTVGAVAGTTGVRISTDYSLNPKK